MQKNNIGHTKGEFDTIQWIEENTKFDSYEIFNIIKRWIANPIDKDKGQLISERLFDAFNFPKNQLINGPFFANYVK